MASMVYIHRSYCTGKLKTAEQRKEYYPVYFVEPNKGNEMALGFDLSSNPTRGKLWKPPKNWRDVCHGKNIPCPGYK